jgi:hypothetical protein
VRFLCPVKRNFVYVFVCILKNEHNPLSTIMVGVKSVSTFFDVIKSKKKKISDEQRRGSDREGF